MGKISEKEILDTLGKLDEINKIRDDINSKEHELRYKKAEFDDSIEKYGSDCVVEFIRNENLSIEVQRKILYSREHRYLCWLVQTKKLDPSIQKEWAENIKNNTTLIAGYENLDISAQKILVLMNDYANYTKKSLAMNPAIDFSIQKILLEDPDLSVICALARNQNLDISVQEILANHCDIEVRETFAHYGNINISVQKIIAKDKYGVRFQLACNNNIDIEIQKKLAKDASIAVRYELARNPSIDISIREILKKMQINERMINYYKPL
jgi:hypothetical protein